MKKKIHIKLMTATVLASSLLLGSCGKKKENTISDGSSKIIQTSSSSKVSSSSQDSKTQKSSSSASSEKAKTSSDQESSASNQRQESSQVAQTQGTASQVASTQQAPQSQTHQTSQSTDEAQTDRKLQDKQAEHNKRYKGVLSMVDGDFSAAAGNWKGVNGETVTVSSGGQFTVESADGKKENYSIQGYSYTLDDGKYNARVGGGKVIQITTGADGTVSSLALIQQ